MKILILSFALAVMFTSVSAVTIYVPVDQPTIQGGINAASNGDTVLVAPGTYYENLSFSGKNIVLRSEDGPSSTSLIPLIPSHPTVLFAAAEGSSAILQGFELVGGVADGAIEIRNGAQPLIQDNVFRDYAGTNVVIHCYESNPSIRRNLFYNNGGISCVGIYKGTALVLNNTFDSNARGFFSICDAGIAQNNIVTNSTEYGVSGTFDILDYNDVWNNNPNYLYGSAGPNDISADPLFFDSPNADYSLSDESPCIDAGNPDAQYNDPDGTRNDMGAYYFHQTCCLIRGDIDHNGTLLPTDLVCFIDWLWRLGPEPECMEEADVEGDDDVDPQDCLYLVNYMWRYGPAPVPCP